VRLVQTDARQSNRELARQLGIAPSTCLERVKSLTRRGVIRGYHAEIDLNALHRYEQALVSVQLSRHGRPFYEALKKDVARWPEVLAQYVVSGEHDVVLHVAVQNSERLHSFLVDRLATRPEVARFQTQLIFQSAKVDVISQLPEAA
jgi:DNA-binding Lrp family transcriptional regulator